MNANLTLTVGDLGLIIEALDCYEYWELGPDLPRNNGTVFLPGDYLGDDDPYWSSEPTEGEADVIGALRDSRRLAALLQASMPEESELL